MAFTANKQSVGTNMETEVSKDGILTIRVDLNQEYGRSASGKTTIIASSKGNVLLDGAGGAVVGLNIYRR